MGIEEERILLEPASESTRENLLYSMALGGKEKSYVLVTNGFHLSLSGWRTGPGRLGMNRVSRTGGFLGAGIIIKLLCKGIFCTDVVSAACESGENSMIYLTSVIHGCFETI